MNQDNNSAVSLFIPRPEHLEEINLRVDKGSELLREEGWEHQNLSRGAPTLLERLQVSDASRSSTAMWETCFRLWECVSSCAWRYLRCLVPTQDLCCSCRTHWAGHSPCAPWKHLSRCNQSLELPFYDSKTLAAHHSSCHQPPHPAPPPPPPSLGADELLAGRRNPCLSVPACATLKSASLSSSCSLQSFQHLLVSLSWGSSWQQDRC